MLPRYFGPTEVVLTDSLGLAPPEVFDMPTALVGIKTKHGFVTAADGLSGRIEDNGTYSPLSCQVQKVFRLEGHGKRMTWAVTGNADIRTTDGAGIAVDIIRTIGDCARNLLAIDAADLGAFATGIGWCVNEAMEAARNDSKFSHYPTENGGDIFRLFIQGYYNGRPEQAVRRFFHIDQVLQEPADMGADISDGRYISGSSAVLNIIFNPTDPRLSAYRVGAYNTLDQTVEFARKCVEVHMTAEARTIDDFHCRAIGGRTHIATITSANGVQWVPGFGPIDEAA